MQLNLNIILDSDVWYREDEYLIWKGRKVYI